MGSTILAYAFDLDNDDSSTHSANEDGYIEDDEAFKGTPKGLIPLADMLNADADRNNVFSPSPPNPMPPSLIPHQARLFHGPETLSMRSVLPIPASSQIFNDYGPLPPSDLLRRYGYVTPSYRQHAVLELPTPLILASAFPRSPLSSPQQAVDYADSHAVLDSSYDLSYPTPLSTAFPSDLLVLLETILLPSDAALETIKERDKLPKPILSLDAIAVLRDVLQTVAQKHVTSIEEDEAILEDESIAKRRRYAVEVRLGEKRILRRARREMDLKDQELTAARSISGVESKIAVGREKREGMGERGDNEGPKRRRMQG